MAGSRFGTTDAAFAAWTLNLVQGITPNPEEFHLSEVEAAAYAVLQGNYALTLAAAINPATKGSSATTAKNLAKSELYERTKVLANQIENLSTVSDQQRHDLGLTVRKLVPTPINPPTKAPSVDLKLIGGWTVQVKLHGEDIARRGMPVGAASARLYWFVGETPPSQVSEWHFGTIITRTSAPLSLPTTLAAGTRVWVSACWQSPRGQTSQACAPVSIRLDGNTMSVAA